MTELLDIDAHVSESGSATMQGYDGGKVFFCTVEPERERSRVVTLKTEHTTRRDKFNEEQTERLNQGDGRWHDQHVVSAKDVEKSSGASREEWRAAICSLSENMMCIER